MKRGPPSFEALYPCYLNTVFSHVLYRVHNHADAEDITAETFEAALHALPRYRGDSGPQAWLLGIAHRKIAQAARRQKQRRRLELLEAELSKEEGEMLEQLLPTDPGRWPDDPALRREAIEVMRRLLDHLPASQREALLLRFEDGLSAREIAHVMNRSVNAVNSLLQRARATIFREGKEYFME